LRFLGADPLGDELLVRGAREARGLFDELPEVVPDQGNALVDLDEIR
jgi:hypothetical protein